MKPSKSTFLILLFLVVLVVSQPQWCATGSNRQSLPQFDHCVNDGNTDRLSHSSWCTETNYHSSSSISFKDLDFLDKCDEEGAHCVEKPQNSGLSDYICTEEVEAGGVRFNSTRKSKTCKVVNFAKPFELLITQTNFKMQFLLISTQKGLVLLDMENEKIYPNNDNGVIYDPTGKLSFGFMDICSKDYKDKAYVVGATNTSLFLFKAEFQGTNFDFSIINTVALNLPVFDLVTFYDPSIQKQYAAIIVGDHGQPDQLRFFEITDTSLIPAHVYDLENLPNVKFMKMQVQKFGYYDRQATQPDSPQCFPTTDSRVLLMLYTNLNVYFFGHAALSTTLDLSDAGAKGTSMHYAVINGEEITAAASFAECFGDFASSTQQIWLSLAISTATGSKLTMVPLTEFTQVDWECATQNQENFIKAPSRARNGCTFPNTDCNARTHYLSANSACVERVVVPSQTLLQKGIAIVTGLGTDIRTPSIVDDLEYTWTRHIFVASRNSVDVFYFQEILCQPTKDNLPKFGKYASLASAERIHHLSISPNAQHLFAALSRTDWEIEAHEQLINICKLLAENPENQNYKKYEATCKSLTPTPLIIYDYLAYFSSCNGGWKCPLFGHVDQDTFKNKESRRVEPGRHVIRPMKDYNCEKGFFCPGVNNARRYKCPVGFKCPSEGLKAPISCVAGDKFDLGCIDPGQQQETICPKGSICFAPHKALPAPPGFYVENGARDLLIPCGNGRICPLQATSDLIGSDSSLCPPGYYCPDPNVLQPIPCKTTFNSKHERINNETWYCPAGTSNPQPCPEGYECNTPAERIKCSDKFYCGTGTQFAVPCPKGFYCPEPKTKVSCPLGYYCKEGSTSPTKCQYLAYCPEGTDKESYALGALLIDCIIVILLVMVFYTVRICCKSYQKKQLKKRLQQSSAVFESRESYDEEKAMLMDVDGTTETSLPKKNYTMDIEFEGLRFRLKKNKKPMLEGASGRFLPGKVNCVLTTERNASRALLDIFSGRSGYGYLDGEIRVNEGLETKMASFHQLIGVVPEQDILEPSFQPREVIRFAGHARLPYKTTFSQIARKANVIIDLLGLTAVQYKEIGVPGKTLSLNEFQRKLVSIGMELIAEPSLLLLENPMSKCKTYAEQKHLMYVLKQVALTGCTVIVFDSKPRYEIFTSYDNVLLISKPVLDQEHIGGGMHSTVYCGPVKGCMQYFEELGFKCPRYTNPADYIVDIASGNVNKAGDSQITPAKLTHYWTVKQKESGKPWNMGQKKERRESVITAEKQLIEKETNKEKHRSHSGFMGQYFIFTIRHLLLLWRHAKGLFFDVVFCALVASLLGGLYFNMEFIEPIPPALQEKCPVFVKDQCALPQSDKVAPISLMTCIAVAICAMQCSLKLFGQDKEIYKKEAQTGINKLSYYLGKLTAHTPAWLFFPFLFVGVWYTFIVPRQTFILYYCLFLAMYFCWTGYGYMMSILLQRTHAAFFATLGILLSAMLSGYSPTLALLKQYWYAIALASLSPLRWAFEGMYTLELQSYLAHSVSVDSALNHYGMYITSTGFDVGMLVVFGVVFRIFGFIILYFQDPSVRYALRMWFRIGWRRGKRGVKGIVARKSRAHSLEESLLLEQRGREGSYGSAELNDVSVQKEGGLHVELEHDELKFIVESEK